MSNIRSHRVLIARDSKREKLIEVGALWPGKNQSLSGDADLIVGKFRIGIIPNTAKEPVGIADDTQGGRAMSAPVLPCFFGPGIT